MEAWMTKKGGRIASWKRRWFSLGPEKLEYFTDTDKKTQKGSVTLADIVEVGHILHETRNHCIGIRTEKRLYVVSCEDETAFDAWLAKLQEIQPKELDAEFTNVPHTSLGNIEKQWFSIVGKKKKKEKEEKDKKDDASTKESPPASEAKPSSSGSNKGQDSTAPASTSDATQGSEKLDKSASSLPADSNAAQNDKSDSSKTTDTNNTTDPSKPVEQRNPAVSLSQDAPSDPAPTPQSLSSSGAIETNASANTTTNNGADTAGSANASSTGFGALHSSFDLDFGMTLNPALTAQPLEESPFAETPSTMTIPQPAPIVSQASDTESSPFE